MALFTIFILPVVISMSLVWPAVGRCTMSDLLNGVSTCSPAFYQQALPRLPDRNSNAAILNVIQGLNDDDWTYFCNRVNTSSFFDCLKNEILLCTPLSEVETTETYFSLAAGMVDGTCPKYMYTSAVTTPSTTTPFSTPTTRRLTTTPICDDGDTKDEGRDLDSNWCYGMVCQGGVWLHWDNFNCIQTTTRAPLSTTTTRRLTTPPRCRDGDTKDEGRDLDSNWCYGMVCQGGVWLHWDNFNCIETTTPLPIQTTTLSTTTPTTTMTTVDTTDISTSSSGCALGEKLVIAFGKRLKMWQSGTNCSGVFCSETGALTKWTSYSCDLTCDKQYLGFVIDNCAPPTMNKKMQKELTSLPADADLTRGLLRVMTVLTPNDWKIVCDNTEPVVGCVMEELQPCNLTAESQGEIDKYISTLQVLMCDDKVTTTTTVTPGGNIVGRGQRIVQVHSYFIVVTSLIALKGF